MDTAIIVALIGLAATVVGSGVVTAVVQYRLSKKIKKEEREDLKEQKLDEIKEDMAELFRRTEEIDDKIDCNEAKRARTQILRFADEIYVGTLHTREHFEDILETCDEYNAYCRDHPTFKNMRTENAQKKIVEIFNKCEKEHSFLDSRKGEK